MDGLTLFFAAIFLPFLMFAVERLLRFTLDFDETRFDGYQEKFRLLTDEEFVSRCRPGTRPETALKVRAILAEVSGIPKERIHPEHSLVDDLRLD